jgi:hypothetical protein
VALADGIARGSDHVHELANRRRLFWMVVAGDHRVVAGLARKIPDWPIDGYVARSVHARCSGKIRVSAPVGRFY